MMEAESSRHSANRKPLIAGLLTLLHPGLGHVYAGRAKRGMLAYALLLMTGLLWAVMSVRTDSLVLRFSYVLIPALWVAVVVDAINLARASERPYQVKRYNRPLVYVGLLLLSGLIVQPMLFSQIKERLARAYVIPGDLMNPALLAGDYIMSIPYRAEEVERGEVVVFRANDMDFVMRAIGLPGDTIGMRDKILYVNGSELSESYVRHIDPESDPGDPSMTWQAEFTLDIGRDYPSPSRDNWGPIVIPTGRYLLLGDNRDNSFDGRYRGLVSAEQIVGRPVWIYFSRDSEGGTTRWHRIGSSIR